MAGDSSTLAQRDHLMFKEARGKRRRVACAVVAKRYNPMLQGGKTLDRDMGNKWGFTGPSPVSLWSGRKRQNGNQSAKGNSLSSCLTSLKGGMFENKASRLSAKSKQCRLERARNHPSPPVSPQPSKKSSFNLRKIIHGADVVAKVREINIIKLVPLCLFIARRV